jgi:hypothetical protein
MLMTSKRGLVMEEMIKYLIWVVLFGIALFGIYKLMGSLGVL